MGNDTKCQVARIGTVHIKIHDGVVRTFSKVHHIPDVTGNGTLEVNGCRYSDENGVLKVIRGAMMLMKGLRQGSLYLLQGTTVTSSAIVCTRY